MAFQTEFNIAWGDCDPAGIVFYPRYFYWFDTTYQYWLQSLGLSQVILQERYGVIGTGILETDAIFHTAIRDGDSMVAHAVADAWKAKSFRIAYRCTHDDQLVAEGHETRAWMKVIDGRIRAAPIPVEFRRMLSS